MITTTLAVMVSGCAPVTAMPLPASPSASPVPVPSSSPSLSAAPTQPATQLDGNPTPTWPTPTPTRPALTSTQPTPTAVADTRKGAESATPFAVKGVVVVSRDHRLSAAYVPAWASRPHGLHPDVLAAFDRLAAAAKRDGLAMSIRSGYRSYATQADSFKRALRQYDEATARRYFAEPGASEHQTGLALDAWDGRNRGSAFAKTRHAAWLAEHAHEFGFIIRYPDGKTDITGVAWEPWHLRYVGTDISAAFGPNSSLTLEEYLGLA